MLLRLRQIAEPRRHRSRLVQPVERDERLDQIGRDRERTRLVDSLALRVLPDRPQALRSALGLVRQKRPDAEGAPRLVHLPVVATGLGPRQRTGGQRLGLCRKPAPDGEERARPEVGLLDQELAVGRLPLVEQPLGCVPVPRPQLEVAEVQPLERVRDLLAADVGLGQEVRENRPRGRDFSAPEEPQTLDGLRRVGDMCCRVGAGAEALADVVDRQPAQGARPAEAVQRGAARARDLPRARPAAPRGPMPPSRGPPWRRRGAGAPSSPAREPAARARPRTRGGRDRGTRSSRRRC